MALITIGGVDIPTPADYQISILDISKASRNANGTMIIERVATKRKIELSWKKLSREQLSLILTAVSPVSFSVTYMDPKDNTYKSGYFYAGDRACPMLSFVNGVPVYKDVKFNIVEL